MKWTFWITFIMFCIIEMLVLRTFITRKMKVAYKSTGISFVLLILLVIAVCIFGLVMPYFSLTLTLFALMLHSFFGYYLNLYNKSKTFDRLMHGFDSFSFAILFFFLLSNFIRFGGSEMFRALFILFLGISIGAIYEIIEFVIDLRHTEKLQRGLKDTDFDIISDVIGSCAAGVLAFCTFL